MAVTFTPEYRANLQEDVAHSGLGMIVGKLNLGANYP